MMVHMKSEGRFGPAIWKLEASSDFLIIRYGDHANRLRTQSIPKVQCFQDDPYQEAELRINERLAMGYVDDAPPKPKVQDKEKVEPPVWF